MDKTEDEYKKELVEAGVVLPEVKEEKAEEPKLDELKEEKPAAPSQPAEPRESRKRSIYDDYKEKKAELKSEKELREQAEHERDELAEKLKTLGEADTPEAKEEASDELEKFAKEINADPQAIRKMRDLFLKDVKPTDESLQKDLKEFKAWKVQNQAVMEKQMFDEEYQSITPTVREIFPNASSEEMEAVKKEIDTISHSKDWHDKDLDYIVFKHKDTLANLVSPKKRGMESKGRKEGESVTTDFDPNADYSKMTMKEREVWEAEYKKLTTSTGLLEDAQGRKLIL